jgi:hypothetical protein
VLAFSLLVLHVSARVCLSVNLALDEAASALFHVSDDHVAEMLEATREILVEARNGDLLDRIQRNDLTDEDVQELSGDAYEMVVEKARGGGWRSRMTPVTTTPSPKVIWVCNEAASRPAYEPVNL